MATLACPRDAVAMDVQAYWKNPRHRCGQCEGLFLADLLLGVAWFAAEAVLAFAGP